MPDPVSSPVAPASGMSFDDVRRYLASRDIDDPQIGSTSLSSVRTQIQENEADYELVKAQMLRKRAQQKAEEVAAIVNLQKSAGDAKSRQSNSVEELRRVQMQAKEKELRAGLERERVLRQLKGVNEGRLAELSKERSKELAIIQKEREALQRREKEMDDLVKKVEEDLDGQNQRMEERITKLKDEVAKSQNKVGRGLHLHFAL